MGCTPSIPSNEDSRSSAALSPDKKVHSTVAIFANQSQGKSSLTPSILTCPSVSEIHDNQDDVICGRLFGFPINCCGKCYQTNRDHTSSNQRRRLHKHISASLTGLNSLLDPESTRRASMSGSNTPQLPISVSFRSSCSSFCSECGQLDRQTLDNMSTTCQDVSKNDLTSLAESGCSHQSSNGSKCTNGSCSGAAHHEVGGGGGVVDRKEDFPIGHSSNSNKPPVRTGGQSKQHRYLSTNVSQHWAGEATHSGGYHSSYGVVDKGEKKRRIQLRSKPDEGMRLADSSNHFTIAAAAASSDTADKQHNHNATVMTDLNDTVVKESTSSEQQPTTPHCCVRHQHRHYRQVFLSQHKAPSSSVESTTAKCCIDIHNNLLSSSSSMPTSVTALGQTTTAATPIPTAMKLDSGSSTLIEKSKGTRKEQLDKCHNVPPLSDVFGVFRNYECNVTKPSRMHVENNKPAKILLALNSNDSPACTLRMSAEQLNFNVSNVNSAEAALNAFVELQPEIVIIDARDFASPKQFSAKTSLTTSTSQWSSRLNNNNNNGRSSNDALSATQANSVPNFDAFHLCKKIRSYKWGEFACILALVTRNQLEENDSIVPSLLQCGFSRCIEATCSLSGYRNELLQVQNHELHMQRRLRFAMALFTAVDACKDGVVITGSDHSIHYANQAIEKMFGFKLDEIIGNNVQDYFQLDLIKEDINKKINNFNEGKEWEGQIYHRRKSGDSVPIWNRIVPINYQRGSAEFIVYIKEFPFLFVEKLMSPEMSDTSFSYGSLKGLRKTSFDVKSDARRPSLAKFNSVSLIEAPITRVINILIAIKENGPKFLAPTLEKAVDILKNSEIFMPQLDSFKPDDQLTSELVSNLINSTKSSVRRMSHEAASAKSSVSLALPPTPTTLSQPSLNNVPSNIQVLLDRELTWSFDVIELERITNKRPLIWLGLSILTRFNVCQTLQCNESTLRQWLTVIESNYHDNPYHNSTHAADVLQATAHFLMSNRLNKLFDPLDQIICLIAAIIHDVDHPGRNSAFLCNSRHELAILYNDITVLENHHAACGFKLTVGPNNDHVNIFKNLEQEIFNDVRQSIIDMVLATDMTKHFEHLSKFIHVFQQYNFADNDSLYEKKNTESGEESSTAGDLLATPENIMLIKRMLIKCADVSNPTRPLKLCQIWAERIAAEYCDQTDEEKSKGLPVVMPTFDRQTCSIAKSQIGFIDYFANDLFEAWHSFGDFPEAIENMNLNYQYWKEQQIHEHKQKKLSLEGSKVEEIDEEIIFAESASKSDHEDIADTTQSQLLQQSQEDSTEKYSSLEQNLVNHVDRNQTTTSSSTAT